MTTQPWYKDGLYFKCTGCGKCCTGGPGQVWVNENEVEEMAQFLKISPEEFLKKYTRKIGEKRSLIEIKRGKNYDCVFLEDKKCNVYGARPQQCRKFPWWPENLESKKSWEEAAEGCEGINNPEAPLIPIEHILKVMKERAEP